METVKQCQICDLRTTSLSFLLRHLTIVHSTQPGFNFCCGLNHCQRTFKNMTTYKHHVYSLHTKLHTNISLDCSGNHVGSSGVSINDNMRDDSNQSEADNGDCSDDDDEGRSEDDGSSEDEDLGTYNQCNSEDENEDGKMITT